MEWRVRAKVDLAERVLEFLRSHPAGQADLGSAPRVLEELVARAAMHEREQRDGAVAERRAMAERHVILESLRRMIRHLNRLVQVTTKSPPQDFVAGCVNDEACAVTVRALLEWVEPRRPLLVRRGMSESLPGLLVSASARLEAAIEAAARAYRQQAEARAELWAVAGRICSEVRLIEGVVRHRVWGDPAERAAWEQVMTERGRPMSQRGGGDVAPAA